MFDVNNRAYEKDGDEKMWFFRIDERKCQITNIKNMLNKNWEMQISVQ
jgi:hypothetical protein